MFQSVRDHFVQHVLPSYREFFELREKNEFGVNDLVRHAVNAATALYHLREHITPSPSVASLVASCPDYDLVRAIANVAKHHHVDRHQPQISHAEQIREMAVVTRYRDAEGEYSSSQVEVVATLDSGAQRRVAQVLFNVMTMWCRWLRQAGVIDVPDPKVRIFDGHVPRRERRELPLRIMQGEEWKTLWQLQRFNYEKGLAEPIELTGAQMTFRVFKPLTLVLNLALREGGPRIEVPLDEEQSAELRRLPPEQQSAFAERILKAMPEVPRSMAAVARVEGLLGKVVTWAASRPDVLGVALVGSYANGKAAEGSDVDLVLVVETVAGYLSNTAWLSEFGAIESVEVEDYGLVQSRRAKYAGGLEVEWGITDRRWVCTDPLDEPTTKVIAGGMIVVYDPQRLIAGVGRAVRERGSRVQG